MASTVAEQAPDGRDAAAAAVRPLRAELVFWVAHTAFWACSCGLTLLVIRAFGPRVDAQWPQVLVQTALCFLATAAMRWLSRHEPLLLRLGVSKIGVIAGGAIISAVLVTLLMFAGGRLLGAPSPTRLELVARLVVILSLLANWCALYFGFQLIQERNSTEFRAMRAESLALRNELQHLQAQISPHFLFNALNTVMACRDDPQAIDTVTQALANYLRFLLRPAATLEPLSRELDALEEYLTVQGVRFGDGLETRIDCDLDARTVLVPPVMVQPLVENAIKYGGQTSPRPIRVDVSARRAGDTLVLEVANTGTWVAPGGRESPGTGLRSLERRLRVLLGPSAAVSHHGEGERVRVRIVVPVQPPVQNPQDFSEPRR
ncbi:MAG: sensor histidine kinase [Planctomycetaceae bacterium]